MSQVVRNLSANSGDAGDTGLFPRLGRSPGEGNGYPLQYSCLGNPKDRGAWQTAVYEIAKSQTWLSDWAYTHMATHSSILAWRIPLTKEPGGLQSLGLQRVGHNWVTIWRRQWHPTPVLLPGKPHGTEEPGRLQSMGSLSQTRLSDFTFHFSLSCIGEGNGNPLQCSCLENVRDGGAWWAAISGVTQSRTRLKWLSSSSKIVLGTEQVLKKFG